MKNEDLKLELIVKSWQLPKLCQILLFAGFDPKMMLSGVEDSLKKLLEQNDIEQYCAIFKQFEPHMDMKELLAIANDMAGRKESFMLDLHKAWQQYGLVPDPAIFFVEYALRYPKFTRQYFKKLLDELDLEASDLLRRLNADTLAGISQCYVASGPDESLDGFMSDFVAAGGDVDALADKFVRVFDFSKVPASEVLSYRAVLKKYGVKKELVDKI